MRLPPSLPLTDAGLSECYGDPPVGVRVCMVMTLDGATEVAGHTRTISDATDQMLLEHLRSHADVVLVGAGTIRAERYGPLVLAEDARARRRASGRPDDPVLATVTRSARFTPEDKIFGGSGPRPIVVTTAAAAVDAAPRLGDVADVVVAGAEQVDLAAMLSILAERGLHRVVCEGGPSLYADLARADLVDELCLTLSPVLTDVRRGAAGTTAGQIAERLELRHALTHEGMLYLRYSRPTDLSRGSG